MKAKHLKSTGGRNTRLSSKGICGPPALIRAGKKRARKLGFSFSRYVIKLIEKDTAENLIVTI